MFATDSSSVSIPVVIIRPLQVLRVVSFYCSFATYFFLIFLHIVLGPVATIPGCLFKDSVQHTTTTHPTLAHAQMLRKVYVPLFL